MKLKLALAAAIVLLLAAKTTVFGDHAALAGLLSVLVLGALIWRVLPGSKSGSPASGRLATGHGHGERVKVAQHEAGHVVAATKLGGIVKEAWITDDEGAVRARLLNDPVKRVAFYAAGREAVKSGAGCQDDEGAIKWVLSEVPSKDRGQVRREGVKLARKVVSSNRGEIRRIAKRLDERGEL